MEPKAARQIAAGSDSRHDGGPGNVIAAGMRQAGPRLSGTPLREAAARQTASTDVNNTSTWYGWHVLRTECSEAVRTFWL